MKLAMKISKAVLLIAVCAAPVAEALGKGLLGGG